MIETGRAVPPDLVFHKCLIGFGGEQVETVIFGLQFRFKTVQAPAVPRQVSNRESGIIVTEQGVKLIPLDFQVEFLCACRIILLLCCIAVQSVVSVGVDGLKQTVPDFLARFFVVIGHGQQPLALDPSLGKEGNPFFFVKFVIHVSVTRVLHIACNRIITHGSFCQADQDPVSLLRLQPYPEFLLVISKIQFQHGFT